MSAYKKYFQQTLLENPYLPGPNDGSSMDAGINDFADDGTDPHAYDVEGISQHKDAIVQRFMNQIQGFANKLAPEAVKSSTFGQIKDTVGKVFKEIDKVNTYAGAKLDQLNNDAPAVIAMTIATDPSKNAAFQKLHKELTEFTTSIEEVEGKFATLKAKIEDFIGDVGEESAPQAGPVGESVKKKSKKVLKESAYIEEEIDDLVDDYISAKSKISKTVLYKKIMELLSNVDNYDFVLSVHARMEHEDSVQRQEGNIFKSDERRREGNFSESVRRKLKSK